MWLYGRYERWRGNYGGKVQLWFPANYVEETSTTEDDNDTSPLGSLQKGTIDLTGVTVGQQQPVTTHSI